MHQRRLNEELDDLDLIWGSIEKALSRSPLSAGDVNRLLGLDFGILVSEYGMDYNRASNILYWLKNESYRLNAQSVTYGKLEDYESRGRRPGSPGLLESTSRQNLKNRIRRLVHESKKHTGINAKAHPLNDLSIKLAKCWGHGEVVDPIGYSNLIQTGIDFTSGNAGSPLRVTESQLRSSIRQHIKERLARLG